MSQEFCVTSPTFNKQCPWQAMHYAATVQWKTTVKNCHVSQSLKMFAILSCRGCRWLNSCEWLVKQLACFLQLKQLHSGRMVYFELTVSGCCLVHYYWINCDWYYSKIIGHEHMVERSTVGITGQQQSVCMQAGNTYSWSFELDFESEQAKIDHNLLYLPSLNT